MTTETFTPINVYLHHGVNARWLYDGDDRFGLGFPVRRAGYHFRDDFGLEERTFGLELVASGWEGFGLALHFRVVSTA